MVDTLNGEHELVEIVGAKLDAPPRPALPEFIHITQAEARRIPSPGTQRALKAMTGRTYDELAGPAADAADRFQTMIWMKLRRDHPTLHWDDVEDIGVQVEEGTELVDPTSLVASESSPASAGSGA